MSKFPTPHINATPDDFAKTVLMPGDPLRSKFIAQNFLDDARLINNIRGVQGYTGKYNGKTVTVMASGMGMPSMGIYCHELYDIFEVENIIRIGSAGALNMNVNVRDLVIAQGACTNSNFASQFNLPGVFSPIGDFKMISDAVVSCKEQEVRFHVGNVLSSDYFYDASNSNVTQKWINMGVLATEMETAALYMTAAHLGKKALSILTVSDHCLTGEYTTAEERQSTFTDMMRVALSVADKQK